MSSRDFLDDRLDALAERYRAARARGEDPSLERLAAAEPDLASAIRELFPLLDVLDQARGGIAPEASSESIATDFGDYEIECELGRGGMGVVYQARQRSLDRKVALKILPGHARLTPRRLARFLREAHAAARLRHPNIVPVFEVGEHDSVHYYAMQLIDGAGLDAVLRALHVKRGAQATTTSPRSRSEELASRLLESDLGDGSSGSVRATDEELTAPPSPLEITVGALPLYVRNVVRIGIQVARALAHAHEEGVLHRDLKPQNLLLDRSGTVWVTDFGLAKTLDGDEITHEGDVLGSPRYLAPESLHGWADPRTDVWGLGVTLYELLTLQPAFRGEDRALLLQHIANDAPLSPRKLDRRIPRDLETIVLTTLEKEPARRYASADALAEDLERFQHGLPILARRASVWHRTGLFLKRHRVGATAVAVVLVVLTIVLSIALAVVSAAHVSESLALERERSAHERAIEERERAEGHFELALQAVHRMLSRLEEAQLTGEPRMEELRRRVYREAVTFHRSFLERDLHDARLLHLTARAWLRLGLLESELDRRAEGTECLRRAEELLRRAVQGARDDVELRAALARTLAYLGQRSYDEGRLDEADATFTEMMQLIEGLLREAHLTSQDVDDVSFALRLGSAHAFLEGRMEDCEHALGEALRLADEALRAEARTSPLVLDAVWEHRRDSLLLRARLHRAMGRSEQAVADLLEVLRSSEGESSASSVAMRSLRAQTESQLASSLLDLARIAEARAAIERSLALHEELVQQFPERSGLRDAQRDARVLLGVLQVRAGRPDAALVTLEAALAVEDEDDRPGELSIARRLSRFEARIHLGTTYYALGRGGEAETVFREVVEGFEILHREVPVIERQPRAMERWAYSLARLGSLLASHGQSEAGVTFLRRSLELYASLPDAKRLDWRRDRILTMAACARALDGAGSTEALAILDEARELARRALESAPRSLAVRESLAIVFRSRRRLLERTGDVDAVIRCERDELAAREAILTEDAETPQVLSECASVCNDLALRLADVGQEDEGLALLERAIDLQAQALEREPRHRAFRGYLVNHHWNHGLLLFQMERFDEAAQAAVRAGEIEMRDAAFLVQVAAQVARCAARVPAERGVRRLDDAMRALQRAVELGFRNRSLLKRDKALAPLREREDFRSLLLRMTRG